MEHADSLGRIIRRGHLDERESPGPPGRAVLHDIDRKDCTRLCKVILQIVFCCGEGKVTDE